MSNSISSGFQLGARFSFLGMDCTGTVEGRDSMGIVQALARDVDFLGILEHYKIPLPEELKDLHLDVKTTLYFYLNTEGTVRFTCTVEPQTTTLAGNLKEIGQPDSLQLKFDITIQNAKPSLVLIELHGETDKELLPEICCERFDLLFKYERVPAEEKITESWILSGSITGQVFDHPRVTFDVCYEKTEAGQIFDLSARFYTPEPLIKIPGIASLDVSQISLCLKKEGSGKWGFSASGDLKIYDLLNPKTALLNIDNGKLSLMADTGNGEVKLEFEAKEAKIESPRIPYTQVVGDEEIRGNLGFDINFGKISLNKTEKEWSFESSVDFCFVDVPRPLDQLISKEIHGTFKVGQVDGKWKVSAGIESSYEKSILPTLPIPDLLKLLKDQLGSDVDIDLPELGEGVIGLFGVWINLSGGLSLDLLIGIGLPAKLNELVGLQPPHQIIKTYDDKKESIIKTKLSIGTEKISGIVMDSPFRKIDGIKEKTYKGKEWIELDIDKIFGEKDLGLISFQKPELAFDLDNGSFKASGGYEIDKKRKVKIPLFPIRKGLELLKLNELAALLPSGIPVESIKFFDKDEKLKVDELKDTLDCMEFKLPKEIWAIVDEIAKVANNLPDRFKDYLSINIPEALDFAIDITADGSVSFDLKVAGDPLQLLVPMLPNPQFMGIRLYRVSFGTAFANSLFKLEIDGEVDTFDLPTLAGSILFPALAKANTEIGKFLPESSKLQNSFIAQDLVILIVYETGIPIPLPLFYKKLEVAYFGITDFEARDVISFPKPSFNAKELLERFNDLKNFFTLPYRKEVKDGDVIEEGLLPLDHYGEPLGEELQKKSDMDIVFSAGPIYLRLPKYLGCKEQEYYEATSENYNEICRLLPGDSSETDREALEILKRKRFLTRAGFENGVTDILGKGKAKEVNLVVDACQLSRPMGQLIGTVKNIQLSAWDLLYLILNTVKKGSINYPIQYFHIDDRIGDFELSLFNVFDVYVTWALTTPNEFNTVAYPKLISEYARLAKNKHLPIPMTESPADELIQLIAENDTGEVIVEDTEGAVIFMRGGLLISKAVIFEAAFGLMLEGARGFRTGVSFSGYVANIVDVKLLGFVKISPKSKTEIFKLLGKSSLRVFNRQVAAGLFELTNDKLVINGMLDLFPEGFPLVLQGHIIALISKDEFLLDSAVNCEIGMLRALASIYMHAKDGINLLTIDLLFINSEFHFGLLGKVDRAAQASLDMELHVAALKLINLNGNFNVKINTASGQASMHGRATFLVGSGKIPLVRGEAQLEASFDPGKGYFGILSSASISFGFLSSAIRFTGGFAFFTWFSEEHAGDFLLSLGGYHPLYKRPPHYPAVTRIGFNWQVNKELNIRGSAYFALTASCIMAGGRLEATWQSGGKKASFVADANFIMAWKPFQYYANLSVNMRLSYTFKFIVTKTFSCELGASLALWGPELSGRAVVRIWKISFPIRFGKASYKKPAPIGWQQFRRDFLPGEEVGDDTALGRIVAEKGIAKDFSKDQSVDLDWLINPSDFKLSAISAIPVKECYLGTEKTEYTSPQMGIAPMGLKDHEFQSKMTISITSETNDVSSDFLVKPLYQNSPKALWGESLEPQLNGSPLIKNSVIGFEIVAKYEGESGATVLIPLAVLQSEGECVDDVFDWQQDLIKAEPAAEAADVSSLLKDADKRRLELLHNFGFSEDDIFLDNLCQTQDAAFVCSPQVWELKE